MKVIIVWTLIMVNGSNGAMDSVPNITSKTECLAVATFYKKTLNSNRFYCAPTYMLIPGDLVDNKVEK